MGDALCVEKDKKQFRFNAGPALCSAQSRQVCGDFQHFPGT
jgi:hypothetical protein